MSTTTDKPRLSRGHMLDLLKQMIRIRRFEGKCAELYTQEKIRGFMHLYDGEEAVAVGVIPVLEKRDRIVATYREHGHALVRGVSMTAVLAEMYGKQEGCSRGRGGSMHLFDRATNFHGGNAIVGGGLPLSIGLALADHMRGENNVTACFFGEGAVAEGEFHESMNLAATVEIAGAVRLRKQSLRDGNSVGHFGIGNGYPAQGGLLSDCVRSGRWHGCRRRRSAQRAVRSMPFAKPESPIFSNAALIGCARIQCSMRNSTATRPKSKPGGTRIPSCGSKDGLRPIT